VGECQKLKRITSFRVPRASARGYLLITLVRQLNATALLVKAQDAPAHRHAFEAVRYAMQQTVERMCEVAGKTHADLAAEGGVMGSQEGLPQPQELARDTTSPE
jgi:hypothetical protein